MPDNHAQILYRAVAILDCFSNEQQILGVREVARRTGISPSAAGRLMLAMRDLRLLVQEPTSGRYSLGSRVLTWAGIFSSSLDIRTIALPAMRELQHATQETISLYIMEGIERVCVERLESQHNVRIVARLGRRLPLYAGSAGKVFLAYLPEAKREDILAHTAMVQLTPNTICDRDVLEADLVRIRARGYATSIGEWVLEAAGVAAPIFDANGDITAVMTISGPTQRFTVERMEEYALVVKQMADQVSRELGYRFVSTVE